MNAVNLPAHLQGHATPDITDRLAGNLGVGSPPYISIMGNRLTLVDSAGDQEPVTTVDAKTGLPYLDACIADVGDHPSKIYYGKPFDPNATGYSPPDCWSDNGIAPSINATVPQSPTCASCPKAVWGSATSKVSGKGIPACSKYQKLALVLPEDDVTFLLRVPPNSLENLRAYNAKFKGQNFSIRDVLTRVSFEAGVLGTLTFVATGFIDEPTLKQRQAVLAAKGTDTLVGRGDRPHPTAGQVAQQETQALPPPATSAVLPSTGTAPPQTSTAAAPTVSPSDGQAQPARRRRRTAAEMAAANAPVQPPAADQQAPFRPSNPPSADAGGQGAPFGMSPGVEPNPELSAALDSIFK